MQKNEFQKMLQKKIVKAITMEQYDLVLKVENRMQTGAMIMLFGGLRKGELLALNWDDIHIEDMYNRKGIYINKSTQQIDTNKYIITEGTKNGKTRFVPLPEFAINYLSKVKFKATSYLVCPQANGELQTPSTWSRYWNTYQNDINYYSYCEKYKELHNNKLPSKFDPKGIPKVVARFNAHQLRHMYCTLLFLSGIDVLTASKLVGHSSVQLTLDIYTHLEEQYRNIDVQKLDNFLKYDIEKMKHDI